jgi:hypothetical protein
LGVLLLLLLLLLRLVLGTICSGAAAVVAVVFGFDSGVGGVNFILDIMIFHHPS